MNRKRVKSLLLFALFALLGCYWQVGSSPISLDEKADSKEIPALLEASSDDDISSILSLVADESSFDSTQSLRLVRPPHTLGGTFISTDFIYAHIANHRFAFSGFCAFLFDDIVRRVSSNRYADGYYLYQLCRLLI